MKTIVYVDGFNLYHGLRSKGWSKFYWLDLWLLSKYFIKSSEDTLDVVRYFTAKVKNHGGSAQRQGIYLKALTSKYPDQITIHYGHYLSKMRQCYKCGYQYNLYEEKMTDVNIACYLLSDAIENKCFCS